MDSGATRKKAGTITGGKLLAIVGIAWIVVLIGVYVVIVRLKLGGEEGIRLHDDTAAPAQSTATE